MVYDNDAMVEIFVYAFTAGVGFTIVIGFVCWGLGKSVQLFKDMIK